MTVNKYEEFTEDERKLSEMMKASQEDLEKQGIMFKEVDYSFMYEDKDSTDHEEMVDIKHKQKKRYGHHLIRAAIIFLCFTSLIFGCSVWLISQEVEADDFTLEKLIYRIKDGLYGTVEGDYIDENTTSVTITSLDDVEKAKRFAPDLKVPGWLPEGTEMVELTIIKENDDIITANWVFQMKSKQYYMNQIPYDNQSDFMLNKNHAHSIKFYLFDAV